MPFTFEGGRRAKQAEEGLQALRRVCDAVIPLPNNVLLQEASENESVLDSFARADEWIGRGVKAIWAMLLRTGMINVDFSTLRQAFQSRGGKTLFGLGSGSGEHAAAQAIDSLRHCPLLTTPENARKADRLLVNITGGPDLAINRVKELMQAVTEEFGMDSHVVMGAAIDETMHGRVEVVVLGTTDLGGRGRASVRNPVNAVRAKTKEKEPAPAAAPAPVPVPVPSAAAAPVAGPGAAMSAAVAATAPALLPREAPAPAARCPLPALRPVPPTRGLLKDPWRRMNSPLGSRNRAGISKIPTAISLRARIWMCPPTCARASSWRFEPPGAARVCSFLEAGREHPCRWCAVPFVLAFPWRRGNCSC